MLARSFLATSLLLACNSKHEPEPAPTPPAPAGASKLECERAVAHIRELDRTKSNFLEEGKQSPMLLAVITESLERRAKLLTEHCIANHWPQAATNCMTAAADFAASEQCAPLLDGMTQPQIKALNEGYEEIENWVKAEMQKRIAPALAGITALRDRMCACTAAPCRATVDKDLKSIKRSEDLAVKNAFEQVEAELEACRK